MSEETELRKWAADIEVTAHPIWPAPARSPMKLLELGGFSSVEPEVIAVSAQMFQNNPPSNEGDFKIVDLRSAGIHCDGELSQNDTAQLMRFRKLRSATATDLLWFALHRLDPVYTGKIPHEISILESWVKIGKARMALTLSRERRLYLRPWNTNSVMLRILAVPRTGPLLERKIAPKLPPPRSAVSVS